MTSYFQQKSDYLFPSWYLYIEFSWHKPHLKMWQKHSACQAAGVKAIKVSLEKTENSLWGAMYATVRNLFYRFCIRLGFKD